MGERRSEGCLIGDFAGWRPAARAHTSAARSRGHFGSGCGGPPAAARWLREARGRAPQDAAAASDATGRPD